MKKIKIKRILLLFTLTIAMIGCFLVKSSSVKASDELIFSVDNVKLSNKDNIIFTGYSKHLDKVVCVTSKSSYCYLDYKKIEYSEEIKIDLIPTDVQEYRCSVVGKFLIILYKKSGTGCCSFIKINLDDNSYSNYDTSISFSNYPSIHFKNENEFYFSYYISGTWNDTTYIKIYNVNNMNIVKEKTYNEGSSNQYISYADDNLISYNAYDTYSGRTFNIINDQKYNNGGGYSRKGYRFENYIFFVPSGTSGDSAYFKCFDFYNNSQTLATKSINALGKYASFSVDNFIYIVPINKSGYIEKFTVNDFQLEGENLVFTDVNNPLSYQDILSKYIPSDKYGRILMTSVKADSYYNSFSTPGNYDATITVSDGYCHEDFAITIVVNKGGGEEEKKESSGSTIKWDTNLMIQSFGGIAVFLVIGLLVVSIIKKILR